MSTQDIIRQLLVGGVLFAGAHTAFANGTDSHPDARPDRFYPAEPYQEKSVTYYDNPDAPWYAQPDGFTPWPMPIRIGAGVVLGALVTALIMRRRRHRTYEPPYDPKPKTGSFDEHAP